MNIASVYDLVVLQTGRDVFLSLDYSPLSQNGEDQEAARTRRIKDLAMTIRAIRFKEKQNEGEETAEYDEKHKTPMVKIKIKLKETFTRRMLNFLEIRPKDVTVDYEKLTTTYRAFQHWSRTLKKCNCENAGAKPNSYITADTAPPKE